MQEDNSNTPPEQPGPPPQQGGANFFGKLFDFSFQEFVTLSIIKVIYILLVVIAALAALGLFIALATEGGAGVVAGLIVAPILFLVYVILARVWLEVLIVVFRIADNTAELVRQGQRER